MGPSHLSVVRALTGVVSDAEPVPACDYLNEFCPRDYLTQFYSRLEGENERLLAFHATVHQVVPAGGTMLEFGGGPTVYQLISAAARHADIHFADYVPGNLGEVRAWLKSEPGAFNWRPFIACALEHEGIDVTEDAIDEREEMMRQRITRLLPGNAFEVEPLGRPASYVIVGVNFVLEGITDTPQEWERTMQNVINLVAPGGYLINTVVTGARYWWHGQRRYSLASVDSQTICETLQRLGLQILRLETAEADITDEESPDYQGYNGMAMVVARRTG
jgi:hypothetical protein